MQAAAVARIPISDDRWVEPRVCHVSCFECPTDTTPPTPVETLLPLQASATDVSARVSTRKRG